MNVLLWVVTGRQFGFSKPIPIDDEGDENEFVGGHDVVQGNRLVNTMNEMSGLTGVGNGSLPANMHVSFPSYPSGAQPSGEHGAYPGGSGGYSAYPSGAGNVEGMPFHGPPAFVPDEPTYQPGAYDA